jgi:hypothetical protein
MVTGAGLVGQLPHLVRAVLVAFGHAFVPEEVLALVAVPGLAGAGQYAAGRTPQSTRLSPRCQRVPTSAKPAPESASTWVASWVELVTW